METVSQRRLYRLAKRLSIGRLLRYLALWARYAWRRGQSALFIRLSRRPVTDRAAQAAVLAHADLATAKRMAVASWFPRDLANVRLHQALLASVAEARPDLDVTPEILDCISRLKTRTICQRASMQWSNRAKPRKPSIRLSTSSCSGVLPQPRSSP
jgi:hypothetical protein